MLLNTNKSREIMNAYNERARSEKAILQRYDIEMAEADLKYKDKVFVTATTYIEQILSGYKIHNSLEISKVAHEEASRIIYDETINEYKRRSVLEGDFDSLFYPYFEFNDYWKKNFQNKEWKVSQFLLDYSKIMNGQYKGCIRSGAPFFSFFAISESDKAKIVQDHSHYQRRTRETHETKSEITDTAKEQGKAPNERKRSRYEDDDSADSDIF